MQTKKHLHRIKQAQGCLIGGAVGDALGAPVEFSSWPAIKKKYSKSGVTDFETIDGVHGAITDDTQMTLFTAEGIIRVRVLWSARGIGNPAVAVHCAYMRWLHTQGEKSFCKVKDNGWLITNKSLWNRRAPGTTCVNALATALKIAQPADNDSKGCGTVMRMAPVGLSARNPFTWGQRFSALTHGHPTGQIAGGAFACLIGLLLHGSELKQAVITTLERTQEKELEAGYEAETSTAIRDALQAAERKPHPDAESIASLGGGWVAEEALAIGIYCALSAGSFEDGVLRAVNHSGDSDSTGAITGNILGLLYGYDGIPTRWRETVELADVISTVAHDLIAGPQIDYSAIKVHFEDLWHPLDSVWNRYPGYS